MNTCGYYKNSKDFWKIIIYPIFDFSPLYISISREDFNACFLKITHNRFYYIHRWATSQVHSFELYSCILQLQELVHRTNVDFLTNKEHNCEYSQVYNMTENLTFEQYFENNCVQRACFTEFHNIHSRMYQFDMHIFSMHINRTRSSLETRYQKVEEISIIVAQTIDNFMRYFY